MPAARRALLVATYGYRDPGLRQLTAPAHDAEALAAVLEDPGVAGFDVTMLVNEPHHVVGEAIADFYGRCGRDDLTLLYFTGHGLKDDEGRLYLAMSDTRRDALMFTALSAAQISDAMDACRSRRKVLLLDCCYSGAFPAGRTAKADEGVQTLERFQGRGRAVLTASDATQYAFEGDHVEGVGTQSLFTRFLVEAIRTGEADLDADGDIALDELYSYVRDRVTAEAPQQRPKKQEDVDGRIVLARNVHWRLPGHLRHAVESPIATQRLAAVDALEHLHRAGNDIVRSAVTRHLAVLADDDSRSVSAAATAVLDRVAAGDRQPAAEVRPPPPPPAPAPSPPTVTPPPERPRQPESQPAPTRAPAPAEPRSSGSPVPEGTPAPAGARHRPPVALWLTLAAIPLLVLSEILVFEGVNGYSVESVGFPTAYWLMGAVLPVVAAAGLLLAGRRTWARPVAAGVLVGAVLTLADVALSALALFVDDWIDYGPGPGWWAAVAAAVLVVGAALTASVGPGPRRPAVRTDWAAVTGTAVVLAVTLLWVWTFYPDQGLWLPVHAQGLLLAASCLPVVALRWDEPGRLLGLTAVSVFGIAVVAGQGTFMVAGRFWPEAADPGATILMAMTMVAACHLSQWRSRADAT